MTDTCTCPPGACHGGHTIQTGPARFIGPDGRVTAERLHQIVHVEMVCTTEVDRSMAAELLALRAYAADHEGRCNTLCPRCGVEVDIEVREITAEGSLMKRLTTAELEKVGELAMARLTAEKERDQARARVTELEAERDQHAETARQATNHAINSTATIAAVRHALAGHPRCEEHPEGDVIKCGWKRAVASVQAAVDASEETR
jgi:hypothetical protein